MKGIPQLIGECLNNVMKEHDKIVSEHDEKPWTCPGLRIRMQDNR